MGRSAIIKGRNTRKFEQGNLSVACHLHDGWVWDFEQKNSVRSKEIAALNSGKNQPIMLKDVVVTNSPVAPTTIAWANVVLCEKGSVIEFELTSKGPYGFGWKVSTPAQDIVNYYLCTDDSGSQQPQTAFCKSEYLQGWTQAQIRAARTIQVNRFADKHMPDRRSFTKWFEVAAVTWDIYGYREGDTVHGNSRGEGDSETATVDKGAVELTGPRGGDNTYPVDSVNMASAERNNGYVNMAFFVFHDEAAKNDFFTAYPDEVSVLDGFD